jgi:hypothetical protein
MGVDVLSIDGFECKPPIRSTGFNLMKESIGAGHPGEEDIGGLVLVRRNVSAPSFGSLVHLSWLVLPKN